jgi:hypothetical protein
MSLHDWSCINKKRDLIPLLFTKDSIIGTPKISQRFLAFGIVNSVNQLVSQAYDLSCKGRIYRTIVCLVIWQELPCSSTYTQSSLLVQHPCLRDM